MFNCWWRMILKPNNIWASCLAFEFNDAVLGLNSTSRPMWHSNTLQDLKLSLTLFITQVVWNAIALALVWDVIKSATSMNKELTLISQTNFADMQVLPMFLGTKPGSCNSGKLCPNCIKALLLALAFLNFSEGYARGIPMKRERKEERHGKERKGRLE